MTNPFSPLQLSITRTAAGISIAVEGDVDLATAPQLGDALTAAAGSGAERVEVDFAEGTFIDSAGLRVLVVADGELGEGRLAVTNAPAGIARIIEMAGLDHLLGHPPGGSSSG